MASVNGEIADKAVGDFIYGVVVATQAKQNDGKNQKRSTKLQLTDNLHVYNTFLSSDKLVKGMQLRGIVEKKEEKGYIVDLCFKDHSKGFLNFKDYDGPEFILGTQVSIIVKSSKSSSQKIIKVKHESTVSEVSETTMKGKTVNYEYIKPGFLVNCTVSKVVDNGVLVEFCNGISGGIFLDHLKQGLNKYKPKLEILARVVTVDFEQKRIGLSETLVDLAHQEPETYIGEILEKVKVVNHIQGKSYLVEGKLKSSGEKIRCMVNKKFNQADITDKKGKTVDKKRARFQSRLYSAGATLPGKIKITEYNYFDRRAIAIPIDEMDEQSSMSWNTIKAGDTLKVTVKEIIDEEYVNVEVNDHIYGKIYREQISDHPQKKISKKLKTSLGKQVQVKVWKVKKDRKILELTMKESVLGNKAFVPSDYDDPRVSKGTEFTGMVFKEHTDGYIIEFMNNLRGYLPLRTLEKYNKKFNYVKGSLVQCYMLEKQEKGFNLTVNKEESINYMPKTSISKMLRQK